MVVHPGRTEPIEKYFEVVERLRARGFAVLVHDWRGQGLSHRMLPDRSPGHADGWADFLEDHGLLLDRFGGELPEPWISLGHSMGGCLALLALAEGETRYAGAILSAPMLGVQLGRTAPFAATATGARPSGSWAEPEPWRDRTGRPRPSRPTFSRTIESAGRATRRWSPLDPTWRSAVRPGAGSTSPLPPPRASSRGPA